MMSGVAVSDVVGLIGAFMIVSAYLLLQVGRIRPESVSFSVTNGIGAAGIIVSLLYDFNLGAMIIEIFWLAISVYGTYRALRLRGRTGSELKSTGEF